MKKPRKQNFILYSPIPKKRQFVDDVIRNMTDLQDKRQLSDKSQALVWEEGVFKKKENTKRVLFPDEELENGLSSNTIRKSS